MTPCLPKPVCGPTLKYTRTHSYSWRLRVNWFIAWREGENGLNDQSGCFAVETAFLKLDEWTRHRQCLSSTETDMSKSHCSVYFIFSIPKGMQRSESCVPAASGSFPRHGGLHRVWLAAVCTAGLLYSYLSIPHRFLAGISGYRQIFCHTLSSALPVCLSV